MFSKMDNHSPWEADDFFPGKIQDDPVDVIIRGGGIAVTEGLLSPSDAGNDRLLEIGRQPVNFPDHDDTHKGQLRGEGGRRAFELGPVLDPAVDTVDDSAAPYVAVEPLAGGQKNYPLRGKSEQVVQSDTDVGRAVARHGDWDIDRISEVLTVMSLDRASTPGEGTHFIRLESFVWMHRRPQRSHEGGANFVAVLFLLNTTALATTSFKKAKTKEHVH